MTKKNFELDRHGWVLFRRIYRDFMRPYLWMFALALFGMAVAAAALASIAYVSKNLVRGLSSKDFDFLAELGLTYLLLFILRGMGSLIQHLAINWSGERVITDMQKRLYRHLVYADLAYFHANSTGALISRLTHDVSRMRYAVTDSLTGLGVHLFTTAGLVGIMFYSDPVLALVVFALLPIAVFPIVLIGRHMRQLSRSNQVEVGRLTRFLDETFIGVRHVKAYAMEKSEVERASSLMERIFRINMRGYRTQSASYPLVDVFGGCAILAVMLYGADQVIGGGKDPGSFASFIVALMLSYHPIKQLTLLYARVQEGLAAADRVFHALDVSPKIADKVDAIDLRVERARVGFENVRFEYRAGIPALNGITFEVPAGKTVALVGPSGAGKSTIMNLVARFYDVSEGGVTINGVDVRNVTISSLRANIALVSQEISLFDDTVRSNIAYGKKDATDEEIVAAAKQAAAHDFILGLPEGYQTKVGGLGVRLSGGERQRIAIARAMLKNAPILLLDEATSALDTKSERQVQAALKTLRKGRTTLVIAHRLSTVFDADMIYVIDAGKLIESGTHTMLINRGGLYAQLHAMQLARGDAKDLKAAIEHAV